MRRLLKGLFGGIAGMAFALWADAPTKIEGARYVEHPANDGDSFFIEKGDDTYLIRLYFVDAPETRDTYGDRLAEQAAYFGVSEEAAMAGGKTAGERLARWLRETEFVVYTRFEDARGAGETPRIYAMVRAGDVWASEWLVERGYARLHGKPTELPDGAPARTHWAGLRKREREAKTDGLGLWAKKETALPEEDAEPEERETIRLHKQTRIFHRDPPHGLVGHLPEGWEVTVGPVSRTGYREVNFISPGGAAYTGEIREISLDSESAK